jgi:hypothetical protein
MTTDHDTTPPAAYIHRATQGATRAALVLDGAARAEYAFATGDGDPLMQSLILEDLENAETLFRRAADYIEQARRAMGGH